MKIVLASKEIDNRINTFDSVFMQWETNKSFDSNNFFNYMQINENDKEDVKVLKRQALNDTISLFKTSCEDSYLIDKSIKNMAKIAMKEYEGKEVDFDLYDIFIFDADNTLWEGEFASEMETPFELIDSETIKDKNGKEIKLKENVLETILNLCQRGKKLGVVSKSEKEGVEYQEQPVILLLKEFGILEYFKEMVVVDRKIPKSAYIAKLQKAVFIDDDIKNLIDVDKNTDAEPVDATDLDMEEILDFDEDVEPMEVIEIEPGEDLEKFHEWCGKDEFLFLLNERTLVKAKRKSK